MPSALEIQNGTFTAIYEGKREVLISGGAEIQHAAEQSLHQIDVVGEDLEERVRVQPQGVTGLP